MTQRYAFWFSQPALDNRPMLCLFTVTLQLITMVPGAGVEPATSGFSDPRSDRKWATQAYINLVLKARLELARLSAEVFETSLSTCSNIRA